MDGSGSWLALGFGYEITALDVWSACHATLKVAESIGRVDETKTVIRDLLTTSRAGSVVRQVLGRDLGLS